MNSTYSLSFSKYLVPLLLVFTPLAHAQINPIAVTAVRTECLDGKSLEARLEELDLRQWTLHDLSLEEQRCRFEISFALYEIRNVKDNFELNANAKILAKVDAFMAMNQDAINKILAAANPVNTTHSRTMTEQTLRGTLYMFAKNGDLNSMGPDFLTTLIFLLYDVAVEDNPIVGNMLNHAKGDSQKVIAILGIASLLGDEIIAKLTQWAGKGFEPIIRAVHSLLRWVAVSANNNINYSAGLPLVGFELVKAKLGNGSIAFYIYPVSDGEFYRSQVKFPKQTGIGIYYTTKF